MRMPKRQRRLKKITVTMPGRIILTRKKQATKMVRTRLRMTPSTLKLKLLNLDGYPQRAKTNPGRLRTGLQTQMRTMMMVLDGRKA